MQSLLAVFVIPIMLLNLLGGVIGGIWLAVLGHWSIIVGGLAVEIASTFVLSFPVLFGVLFAVPGMAALEHNRYFLGGLLGAASLAWTLGVISIWCLGAFVFVLPLQTGDQKLPYLLWAYMIATGPWTYMATWEAQANPNSAASITAFFACMGAAVIIVGVLITGDEKPEFLIECFSIPMLICFVFQLSAFVTEVKYKKQEAETYAEAMATKNSEQSKVKSAQVESGEASSEDAGWYIFFKGKQIGPATFDDLRRLAQRGLLTAEMQVWCPDQKRWLKAQYVYGLFKRGIPRSDNEESTA